MSNAKARSVGLDFGTSNSAVTCVDAAGVPVLAGPGGAPRPQRTGEPWVVALQPCREFDQVFVVGLAHDSSFGRALPFDVSPHRDRDRLRCDVVPLLPGTT